MLDPRLIKHALTAGPPRLLSVGARAPSFTLPAHDGTTVRLDDHAEGKVLVWFYPAADTPG